MNLRQSGALSRVPLLCPPSVTTRRPPGRSRIGRRSGRARTLLRALATTAAVAIGTAAGAQQPAADPPPEGDAQPSGYAIGAGDVLQVFVWKEPELTRDVTVRLDGRITVPLIGDIQAAGRTPSQLAEEVETALKRYISSPQVTLGVLETKSASFYMLGQVTRPGAYPLTGRVTLLQGLALAGGFREYAKTDKIVIIRQEGGEQQITEVDYDKLKSGKNLDQNVVLRPGDTIVVP